MTKAQPDRTYESLRNQLIPLAMNEAFKAAGEKPTPTKKHDKVYDRAADAWNAAWNSVYFRSMDRLARENGLMA